MRVEMVIAKRKKVIWKDFKNLKVYFMLICNVDGVCSKDFTVRMY